MTDNSGISLQPASATYWRSMGYFNLYRISLTVIFIFSYFAFREQPVWENYNAPLYFKLAIGYLIFSLLATSTTWLRWPDFDRQVTQQTSTDIVFIVALMYSAGGIKSGIGVLLVVAIAAASLISQGRLALFYAALASIALLLEQSYQLVSWQEHYDDYTHAVMLCLSCFATAWLAHSFAKRTLQSEALATQREVDLENLEQVNALITQEMQDGVLVVDKDYTVRHHNVQAEGLLYLGKKSWYGKTLDECAPELAQLMRDWVENTFTSTRNAQKFNWRDRELRLRFMPVGTDRKQGAVIFIEDWSQMQIQAQQIKLAALGRLTANIAHEIRNPLSAISHANQLLQEDDHQDASSRRMFQIISDNVQRMDQMVKDILELNRRDRTNQETIDLCEFLDEFHEQFCQTEKVTYDGFCLQNGSTPLYISFDKRHLHQILWNLCRNGWRHSKHTANSLNVRVVAVADSSNIQVEVVDDGPGIPIEIRQHLFEPFFTTESTGTGLGLYIARELCEANGATLKYVAAESGSVFSLQLNKIAQK